jgi:succinate-semialdehyde dehydrogenase/glutarate-semialdehyde dehydrogenase
MDNEVRVRNPYTGDYDYGFSEPDAAEVTAVCERLRGNQPAWAALELTERIAALQAFATSIAGHRDDLVTALTADTGRSQVPVMEVDALAGFIARAAADAPVALAGKAPRAAHIPIIEGSSNRIPLGLIGNISPWNFPVILSFLDTFPALVAGNSVVIKPSEVTPRWVEPMRAAIADCPEIQPVLDIVVGTGTTGALINENVDAVVFTGSVATGRKVGETAARNFIPAFLELGGKDPAIVLASAALDLAVRTATFCSVQSTGQACQSLERVYVARPLYDDFVAAAVTMAESLPINYPDIDSGVVGPFIFAEQASIVMKQLADAKGQGANILCGGELLNHGGFWIRPTVVTDVTHDMRLMQEETFGPVMPIMAFDSEEEALALANDSKYGLSAAVFAGSLDEGREFARQIQAGAVSVNDAALTAAVHEFEHDAFGYSGLGASRAGSSAYTRFTRQQAVMANTAGQPVMLGQLGE